MTSVFPLIAHWDNIKIHEHGEGNPSITQWTVVSGAAQALKSWLLYTHVQAGWNMRAEDIRSSQNAKLSLPIYISHPLSLSSLRCALQPIWRLINPEGLLFRWGFPLSPHCTPSILTSLAPTTQPASHPSPCQPGLHPSSSTFSHTYRLFQSLPFCIPQGRHGAVPRHKTEVTDVLLFFIFGVIWAEECMTVITFIPSVLLIMLIWDIFRVFSML